MRHAQEQAQEEEKAHLDEARRMLAELEANASARAHQADGNAALHDDEPAHQAPQQAPPAHQAPQQYPPAPAQYDPPAVAVSVSDDEEEAWGEWSGKGTLHTAARRHGRP